VWNRRSLGRKLSAQFDLTLNLFEVNALLHPEQSFPLPGRPGRHDIA